MSLEKYCFEFSKTYFKAYCQKHKYIYLICVLDSICTPYASKYTCVLSKPILELIVKNIDILSYMCSGSYPYTLSFKSV